MGSSSKSSSSVIHLCRSVNRTVAGSRSGNFSWSAYAISSSVLQFNSAIGLAPFERPSHGGADDHLRQLLRGRIQLIDLGADQRVIVAMVNHQQLVDGPVDG